MGTQSLIVLDTHAWIWYAADDPRLSRRAKARIRGAKRLGVHPISCWEIAMLVEHRRLRLSMAVADWVEAALDRPKIELLSFSPAAAVRAAGLGAGFPEDPADRFIVATALEIGAPLATSDLRIKEWGQLPVIW